jgi:pyrophosphatase PpaX
LIVIFDLDGTVVDTYPVIRKTLIEVFDKYLPNLEYDEDLLMSFFGPTLYDSFMKLTNNDDKQAQFLIDEYRKINKRYYETEIKLFENAYSTLEYLEKGHVLAILSNRVQSLVEVGLKVTKIDKFFKIVLGIDRLKKPKPHPDGINQILEKYKNKKAVFVGDAITDVQCAKAAGIISIGITWALTKRAEFEEVGADYIVDSFTELKKVLEEINV